jgi:hypothetical protein
MKSEIAGVLPVILVAGSLCVGYWFGEHLVVLAGSNF